MRMIAAICLFILVSACGSEKLVPIPGGKEIVILEPKPKMIEVGSRAHYVLDPAKSSNLVKSGYMDLEVVSRSDTFTQVGGGAEVQTVIGPKTFDLTRNIENELLTSEFMAELRGVKAHQAAEFLVSYVELTPNGCDVVRLTGIKDMDGTVIEPTICIAARTIPHVAVTVKTNGMTVPVLFKLTN